MTRNSQAIVQSLEIQLNLLSDQSTRDRFLKKKAFETVKKEAFDNTTDWTIDDATELFDKLNPSLLSCTESNIEGIREQAVILLRGFVTRTNGSTTSALLECARQRLTKEPTEEIRASWLLLVRSLVEKATLTTADAEICLDIIQLAVSDPFPEAQKESAHLLIALAQKQTNCVKYAGERTVKMMIGLLLHKHAPVRSLAIKAIEAVLVISSQGMSQLFEYDEVNDRPPVIPALVYDTSASVRSALIIAMGHIFTTWAPLDRYTYADRMLPVLFAATADELLVDTSKEILKKVDAVCIQDMVESGILEASEEKEGQGNEDKFPVRRLAANDQNS
ncbi:HEAT repeat-containing protein 2 [Apophysomyces ossiformis]|uniref:HEAT repeat-containing protein 2 n=1 Tax=Apophysomyces ossiformis TaxID=679940 RepID=A0A8H7BZI8_9FUNG|nr:HEAT repeat-containing protein 2 [Apophysomyces ossiformis]